MTYYGGVYTGEEDVFLQKTQITCGQAVLAYFLTKIGKPHSESSIIEILNNDTMLSFADFVSIFKNQGLKTQALQVDPLYFMKNSQTSILHLSYDHFIIFLEVYKDKEVKIFDPAYGLVYVSWDKLLEILSGYMLYVYQ